MVLQLILFEIIKFANKICSEGNKTRHTETFNK